jgi:hypothetical protein
VPAPLSREVEPASLPRKVEAKLWKEPHGSHVSCFEAVDGWEPDDDLDCSLFARCCLGLSVDLDLVTAASLGDTPRLGNRGGVDVLEVTAAGESAFSSSM